MFVHVCVRARVYVRACVRLFECACVCACLGALWSPSLSCSRWIEGNIEKARGAFFARGSGVFHGMLNPLSSKSIVEHCVLSCLLFWA